MNNTFNQFGLRDELVKSVMDMGFETPSPIQQETIPLLINQSTDIIALAQTGTGKTAAFGLPLLHRLDLSVRSPQALVLSPTRELCMQIKEEITKYAQYLNPNIVAVYGGASITEQIRNIKKGAHIIVATPGRLIDLLERKAINLSDVDTVVLDEADEMLNMGFREDIDLILDRTTTREEAWLFSATMNRDVRRIAKRFMNEPVEVAVAKENIGNENIDHQYFLTTGRNRFPTLKRVLDFNPEIYGIIFTRTKQDAHDISEYLVKDGYRVSALHGDLDQRMRTKVMNRFKNKQLEVIVATDVAARGIDVNDITHVINYELPDDPEVYTHRSGRTARAGKSGICVSIVTKRELSKIKRIEKIVNSKFQKTDIPDGAEIIRKKLLHFLEQVDEITPKQEFSDIYKEIIHDKLEHLSKDELINRLLWMRLNNTISEYQDAPELNAGFDEKEDYTSTARASKRGKSQREIDGKDIRCFINLGRKDGLTPKKLAAFIADTIHYNYKSIDRITINDTSSFFNIPKSDVSDVLQKLSKLDYKGRKIRVEEAENNSKSSSNKRSGRSKGDSPKGRRRP